MFLSAATMKKYVIKLLIPPLLHLNPFLTIKRLTKAVINLLIIVLLCFILFLNSIFDTRNIWQNVCKENVMLTYWFGRLKTQKIHDQFGDIFLPTLKLVPNWLIMNKRLQELNDAVFSKDDIVFVNKTSGNVIFVDADLGIILYSLIILPLIMIVLMRKILKALFSSRL